MGPPRPLTSYDELLTASGGDPVVRWDLDPSAPVDGWAVDGAAGWVRFGRHHRKVTLAVVGQPSAAADLAVAVTSTVPEVAVLTLPRGTPDLLDGRLDRRLRGGADWDWMWTQSPPPRWPGEPSVVRLDETRYDDVSRLLDASSPRASTRPGDPGVLSWHGIEDESGVVVACGARTDHAPGAAHLSSIATRPDRRGGGLGAAVTAALARRALDEGLPVVTLGMYADNDVARRLYQRLGFLCDNRFSTRLLV